MTLDDLSVALSRLFGRGIAYDLGGVNIVMDACHVTALVHASYELQHAMKQDVRTQHVPGFCRKMPRLKHMNGKPVVVNLEYLRMILDVLGAMGAHAVCIRSGMTDVAVDPWRTMPYLMEIIPFMDEDDYDVMSTTKARFMLAGITTFGDTSYMTEAEGEYPMWSQGAFDSLTGEWSRRMDGGGRDG